MVKTAFGVGKVFATLKRLDGVFGLFEAGAGAFSVLFDGLDLLASLNQSRQRISE